MTSNIGSDIILQSEAITDEVKQKIESLLHKQFRPEFLNRIDAIAFFKRLSQKDVEEIAHIQISEIKKRLSDQHIELKIDNKAIALLAELGYSKEFGARPLKRIMQQKLVVPLSQQILKRPDVKVWNASAKNEEIVIND